jgi:predicted TIM-barrel enzyme
MFIKKYFSYHRNWAVFASIDFKYQSPAQDLEGATLSASTMYEVTVTSGPATGEAPTVEKLQRMRKAAGDDSNIALASGVTAENIREFLPYVDTFMVATGVSKDFHELDDAKIRELHDILRPYPIRNHTPSLP